MKFYVKWFQFHLLIILIRNNNSDTHDSIATVDPICGAGVLRYEVQL